MPRQSRARINRQIRTIRRLRNDIDRAVGELVPSGRDAQRVFRRMSATKRRKPRLSPRRRAALELQGRYMGYMRRLTPRLKAKVRALKAKRGFPAAIAMARRLARD